MDIKEILAEIDKKIQENLNRSKVIEMQIKTTLQSVTDTSKSYDEKAAQARELSMAIEHHKNQFFELYDIGLKLRDYCDKAKEDLIKFKQMLTDHLLSSHDVSIWEKIKIKFGK